MAHRGAVYTNDQVREFLQVGTHFEPAKHAVGRRVSWRWVPIPGAPPSGKAVLHPGRRLASRTTSRRLVRGTESTARISR